jgi:predicted GIY-YIG superfamily endonuclease
MHIIYLVTNTINGHRYIGATKHSLDYRRKRHVWDAFHGPAYCRVFHAALRKYGETAFSWSILSTVDSLEEAMTEETRLIKELKPEYNITVGGRGMVGIPWSPERRAKILAKLTGRKLSPEHIARMKAMPRDFLFKPIVCIQDRRTFDSIKGAAAFYGIPKNRIACVLRGGIYANWRQVIYIREGRAFGD